MFGNGLPDHREIPCERHQMLVLRAFPDFTEAGMIAVLLAPPHVAAGRLHMAVGVGTDPYISPGRRDHDRTDAREEFLVTHPAAVRMHIGECRVGLVTADAGLLVGNITQPD